MTNDKRTNNDLQNITLKTKDPAKRTTLEPRDKLRSSGRVNSSCSTSGTHSLTLVTNPVNLCYVNNCYSNKCWGYTVNYFICIIVGHADEVQSGTSRCSTESGYEQIPFDFKNTSPLWMLICTYSNGYFQFIHKFKRLN